MTCVKSRNEKSRSKTGKIYPRGVEQIVHSTGNQGVAVQGGAKSGALSGDSVPIDPDLAAVVAAWPGLPETVRRQVVALVGANCPR